MLYLIHHTEKNAPVELRGEASADVIAGRFDCTLPDMIDIAEKARTSRSRIWGLATGTLYITERGKRVVYIAKA
jgi:hypothetical protein